MRKKKNIEYQLEIERKDAQNPSLGEYDFIFPLSHLTSIDEQKVKVKELTEISNINKKPEPNYKNIKKKI